MRLLVSLLAMGAITASAADPPRPRGEFLKMWDAVMSGSQMGAGDGWFGPSQTRYTWQRLAAKFDKDRNGIITARELPPAWLKVLDRDGNGAVTADDLDWSDDAAFVRQMNLATQIMRRADSDGNRKLTKAEWAALYDVIAKGESSVDLDGVRRILFPPTAPRPTNMPPGQFGPRKEVLLFGLLTGELGSAAEGPKLEAVAPDFTLSSPDQKTTIRLADYRNKKPVVLIFGSFT